MYVHASVARLWAMRPARATSEYSSACQSCDSICVVSGFHVRPRPSTKERANVGQSAPGTDTTCAAHVPVAPLILPRYSVASTRLIWRDRRCANTAISLPTVTGVAGWPCVCASIGTAAPASARPRRRSRSARIAGSHTCSVAALIVSAYARLLMSSEVQKMWTTSRRDGSVVPSPSLPAAASRYSPIRYSTALTSWRVTASFRPASDR